MIALHHHCASFFQHWLTVLLISVLLLDNWLIIYPDLHTKPASQVNLDTVDDIVRHLIRCQQSNTDEKDAPTAQCTIDLNRLGVFKPPSEVSYDHVQIGGHSKPKSCRSIQKVAIVVPYRDREEQLEKFVNYMHIFLTDQLIDYTIYVVEQHDLNPFNRAKLFNVGILEIAKLDPHVCCFIFHDVDLLPMDQRNLYACSSRPRHMSEAVDTLRFQLLYPQLFGGAIALSYQQLLHVGGFANRFFGWGGEDDDMYQRIRRANLGTVRWSNHLCRYRMMPHKKAAPNPKRFELLQTVMDEAHDSLNGTIYELLNTITEPLYTKFIVEL